MVNYYLKENSIITQSADFKFDENCLETDEEIVRNDNGVLMLKADYDNYIQSDDYKIKLVAEQNTIKKADLQSQIDVLDKKSIRAIREGGIYDSVSGKTWLEYYQEQITALRKQIADL